jgi:hypothetical protein
VKQNTEQPATVDADLRHGVAGVDTARFTPNHLAQPIGVNQLARADAGRVKLRQQAERCQLLDRMRQHVDANAQLAQLLACS